MVNKYIIAVLLSFIVFKGFSQKTKKYTNWCAYELDVREQTFQEIASTPRTKLCKSIIENYKKEQEFGEPFEIDWKIEKDELLNSKDLIEISSCLLIEDYKKNKTHSTIFKGNFGDLMGPFKSQYGSFKFIEVLSNSKNHRPEGNSNGVPIMSTYILDKSKASKKELKDLLASIKKLFLTGEGDYNTINDKYKKYRGDSNNFDECTNGKETNELWNKPPDGRTFHIIECEDCFVFVCMTYVPPNVDYIKYKVYLFQ